MQKNIVPVTNSKEELETILLQSITKRKKTLMRLAERFEQLKIELAVLEEEYEGRIGNLYRKDNLLDLEIIRYKKINELMEMGLSYDEAIMHLQDLIKKEQEQKEKIDEYISIEEEGKVATNDEQKDVRSLWKKLVHKFHPDLTVDENEKRHREEIMKKINLAYKNNDFQTLLVFQGKVVLEEVEDRSVEQLEKKYEELENAILRLRTSFKELKKSEWYSWRKKTKEQKEKLYTELQRKVIRDILTKEMLLTSLKKRHNNG